MATHQDIKNRIPITAALMMSTLMMALDGTIANVALPHIQGSVSASLDEITWVLTSYILASAVMTPLGGWLSERFGRKNILILSVAGFTAASMLCGIATSLPELVLFRVLQGLSGAALMPLSQTILLDLYPTRLLPRVMSIWSAAIVIGPIAGPTVGGWITENLSWRWVFYINLPIGAAALFIFYAFMSHDKGGRQRPFDFLGFGALVMFLVGLQMCLDRGSGQDWFNSPEIWIEAVAAGLGLFIFVLQTLTVEHPFFHRDLAKDVNFVGGAWFGFCFSALLFSTSALLPSFMQNLLGYSALQAGIAAMPRGVGSLIAFIAVPALLARFGPRVILSAGVLLGIWSTWQMSQFDLLMSAEPIMWAGLVQGIGMGLMFTPLTTLTFATLPAIHRSEGTVVSTMLRSLGSSIGISAVQAIILRNSSVAHARLAEHLDPSNPVMRAALPPWMNPATGAGLQALNGEVTRQATMMGYVNAFSWMTLGVVCLFPIILLLKSPKQQPIELELQLE